MQITDTKKNAPVSTRVPGLSANVEPLIIVYELEKGSWRAFIHPYGETTEASTKKTALKKIRSLAKGYRFILEKYNSPIHLVHGYLGDLTDREVFAWVVNNKLVMEALHSNEGKVDSKHFYVEAYRNIA